MTNAKVTEITSARKKDEGLNKLRKFNNIIIDKPIYKLIKVYIHI